jgi:hypothetical protein
MNALNKDSTEVISEKWSELEQAKAPAWCYFKKEPSKINNVDEYYRALEESNKFEHETSKKLVENESLKRLPQPFWWQPISALKECKPNSAGPFDHINQINF